MGLEARCIAEYYIDHVVLHEDEKSIIKAWHTNITIAQAMSALRRKSIKSTTHYTIIGLNYNPLWMVEFIRRLPRRAFVYLTKNLVVRDNDIR